MPKKSESIELIKCSISKISFITDNPVFVENIEYSSNFLEIPFCVVNSNFVCLDGNKRVKSIQKNCGGSLDIFVLQKSDADSNLYDHYYALNSWRKLSSFEYLFLVKSGFSNKNVKGFNAKYCDTIIEKLFKIDEHTLEFVVCSNYSMKSLTELFHLDSTAREFVLKVAKKFQFNDNELASVSSGFAHISVGDAIKMDLHDKRVFFESFYAIAYPVMYRLNSQLKKINLSLPKGVSVLNHDNYETKIKEMRISFTGTDDLIEKMRATQILINSGDSGLKSKIDSL